MRRLQRRANQEGLAGRKPLLGNIWQMAQSEQIEGLRGGMWGTKYVDTFYSG